MEQVNKQPIAPIVREYDKYIILAQDEIDYKNKVSKIDRGDTNGFYLKEDYYKQPMQEGNKEEYCNANSQYREQEEQKEDSNNIANEDVFSWKNCNKEPYICTKECATIGCKNWIAWKERNPIQDIANGRDDLPYISGSWLLFELMQVAAIKNEDGMPIVHYVDKPNGGSVAYLRHDAVVNKLNSMLAQLLPIEESKLFFLIKKYSTYISNIEWHIKTNEPPESEIEKLNSQIDYYKEMLSDILYLKNNQHGK